MENEEFKNKLAIEIVARFAARSSKRWVNVAKEEFINGAKWANESQSKTIEQLTKERDELKEKLSGFDALLDTMNNQAKREFDKLKAANFFLENEKDGLIQENRMLKEDNGRLEKANFHIKCDWADMAREKDREIESLKGDTGFKR